MGLRVGAFGISIGASHWRPHGSCSQADRRCLEGGARGPGGDRASRSIGRLSPNVPASSSPARTRRPPTSKPPSGSVPAAGAWSPGGASRPIAGRVGRCDPERCALQGRVRGDQAPDRAHARNPIGECDRLVDPEQGQAGRPKQAMVARVWRASGLQPHRHGDVQAPPDPGFVSKVWDAVGLYLGPPDRALWSRAGSPC